VMIMMIGIAITPRDHPHGNNSAAAL